MPGARRTARPPFASAGTRVRNGGWQVRGNGGAGSGPRRCADALEAAGQAAPPIYGETPVTPAAYSAALSRPFNASPCAARAHCTSPARPDRLARRRRALERYAEPGPHGLVFIGPKGAPLRRTNFRRIWVAAGATAGAPGVHFHDLRHTGGTLAATTAATIKDLMARLGNSSPRAAMIYQYATSDRDQAIAQALGDLARQARTAHDEQAQRKPGKPCCGLLAVPAWCRDQLASLLPAVFWWSGRRESNPHDQLGRLVTFSGPLL
jgi:hypothetical protein